MKPNEFMDYVTSRVDKHPTLRFKTGPMIGAGAYRKESGEIKLTEGVQLYHDMKVEGPITDCPIATLRYGIQRRFMDIGDFSRGYNLTDALGLIPDQGILLIGHGGVGSGVGDFNRHFMLVTKGFTVVDEVHRRDTTPWLYIPDYSRLDALQGQPIKEGIDQLVAFCADVGNFQIKQVRRIA